MKVGEYPSENLVNVVLLSPENIQYNILKMDIKKGIVLMWNINSNKIEKFSISEVYDLPDWQIVENMEDLQC